MMKNCVITRVKRIVNPLPKTMKGVLLIDHGGEEMNLYREDLPLPSLHANDVLIKVSAAGVNNTDINTRIGWYSKGNNDSEDASWSGEALPERFEFLRLHGIRAGGVSEFG